MTNQGKKRGLSKEAKEQNKIWVEKQKDFQKDFGGGFLGMGIFLILLLVVFGLVYFGILK